MGCNATPQDSPLLRNAPATSQTHGKKAGGSRTRGLSKPKHCAHRFGVANMCPASMEAKCILGAWHARLHLPCSLAEMPYYDLFCLEIRRATQSGFLQPSGARIRDAHTTFSTTFQSRSGLMSWFLSPPPPAPSCFADGFFNMKKAKQTRKAGRSPNAESEQGTCEVQDGLFRSASAH